jgi:hypothetical protein
MQQKLMARLAVLVAVVVPALVAGTAQGASPNKDRVQGSGVNGSLVPNRFEINAQSDPDGSNPQGQGGFADTPDFKFKGEVVCLRVSGNRATVVVRFEHTKNQPPQFGGDVMFLEDNGKLPGTDSPDFITNARITPAQTDAFAANGCPATIHPTTPVASGDIKIEDVQ